MKTCFKCGLHKPLSEYYKHPEMSDGHLNKCKACTSKDTLARQIEKSKDSEWVEKEKARGRDKFKRLGYAEKYKPSPEQSRSASVNGRNKYPEKYKARIASQRMPKRKGYQLHHWSYQPAHWRDLIELTITDHAKIHRYITYDQPTMMYRIAKTGELLDTREKHEAFIKYIEFLR